MRTFLETKQALKYLLSSDRVSIVDLSMPCPAATPTYCDALYPPLACAENGTRAAAGLCVQRA